MENESSSNWAYPIYNVPYFDVSSIHLQEIVTVKYGRMPFYIFEL